MIRVIVEGSTAKTEAFLDRMIHFNPRAKIEAQAQRGVDALRSVTPRDSGATADQWRYEILQNGSSITIWWINDHNVNGFNVAVGLQYGHGTGQGGYIQGIDYINPALRPVFDDIAGKVWEEVQRA